jgi:hypothetical protein
MTPPTRARSTQTICILTGAACLLLVICLGCNPVAQGPPRYAIKGIVTFGGEPIPIGRIRFEPDPAAGKDGPVGVAEIENGRYETGVRFGAIGGPHLVVIEGFESPGPQGLGPEEAYKPLFPEYSSSVDLPLATSTQNFDVPRQSPSKPPKR